MLGTFCEIIKIPVMKKEKSGRNLNSWKPSWTASRRAAPSRGSPPFSFVPDLHQRQGKAVPLFHPLPGGAEGGL